MQIINTGKDDWKTPAYIFQPLHDKYQFTLDAASSSINNLLPVYWSKEKSAFKQSWKDHRVWINPPYGSEYPKWVKFAFAKCQTDDKPEFVILLISAKTDTKLFHELLLPAQEEDQLKIKFLKGRIMFIDPITGKPAVGNNGKPQPPQFGSMLVGIHGTKRVNF